MDSIHYTVEGSTIKETLRMRGTLSPSAIGDLSERLGNMPATMDEFFKRRVARTNSEFHSLDLTSISTYSDMEGWAQWGPTHPY